MDTEGDSTFEVITVHAAHFHSWCCAVQKAYPRTSKLLELECIFTALNTSRVSILFSRVWKFYSSTYSPFSGSDLCYSFPVFAHLQVDVLAFYRPWQLCELALVVDHLQVLDVVSDVAGTPQREGVVWVWMIWRRNCFWLSICVSVCIGKIFLFSFFWPECEIWTWKETI